jgi:hypothetical protein
LKARPWLLGCVDASPWLLVVLTNTTAYRGDQEKACAEKQGELLMMQKLLQTEALGTAQHACGCKDGAAGLHTVVLCAGAELN